MADLENTKPVKSAEDLERIKNKKQLYLIISLADLLNDVIDDWKDSEICSNTRGDARIKPYIKKYLDCLRSDTAKFKNHIPYFMKIYNNKRSEILKTVNDDNIKWIESDVVVWYGEDIPQIKRNTIKLPVSIVYTKAVSLREEIDNSRVVIEKGQEEELCDAYFYADEMIYFMFMIFKECIIELQDPSYKTDLDILTKACRVFASNLAIEDESKDRKKKGGGFKPFITKMMKLFGGTELGDEIGVTDENFDEDKISDMADSLFSDDKINKTIGTAIKGLKSGKLNKKGGLTETLKEVASALGPAFGDMMETQPPEGVHDNRTEEEKAKDKKKREEEMSRVTGAFSALGETLEKIMPNEDTQVDGDNKDKNDDIKESKN